MRMWNFWLNKKKARGRERYVGRKFRKKVFYFIYWDVNIAQKNPFFLNFYFLSLFYFQSNCPLSLYAPLAPLPFLFYLEWNKPHPQFILGEKFSEARLYLTIFDTHCELWHCDYCDICYCSIHTKCWIEIDNKGENECGRVYTQIYVLF